MKYMSYIKRAIRLFSNFKFRILCIIAIFLALTGISMLLPFVTEGLIDYGFAAKNFRKILMYALAFLGLYILSSMLAIVRESFRIHIYNGVKKELRKTSLNHLLKIRMEYFTENHAANIYQMIEEDIAVIAEIVGDETLGALSSIFVGIGGCVSLCMISWKLTLLLLVYIPVKYLVTRLLARKNAWFTKMYLDSSRDYSEWFGEFVSGIHEIRYFNLGGCKKKEFEEKQTALIGAENRRVVLTSVHEESQNVLIQALMAAIYIAAGAILLNEGITLGGIIAFETYALLIATPISELINLVYNASALIPSLVRFFDFMDEPEEVRGTAEPKGAYDITYLDVSFAYDPRRPVIRDLSLTIRQGEKVALTGKNGAGKSTLMNLLLGTVTPQKGNIQIGGRRIDEYSEESFRDMISVVSQEVFLFHDTIRNNICLDREVSEEELAEVIRAVNLTDLVEEKTLDYVVGQNGSMLSGGQKQKIAIARALVRHAPILILDEPTSSLDAESVVDIGTLVREKMEDCTVICITHEKQMADHFDRVYLLNEGRV